MSDSKCLIPPDTKFVWKIESTMAICPLVESTISDAIHQACMTMPEEIRQNFVAGIYKIEKVGMLPQEHEKLFSHNDNTVSSAKP